MATIYQTGDTKRNLRKRIELYRLRHLQRLMKRIDVMVISPLDNCTAKSREAIFIIESLRAKADNR